MSSVPVWAPQDGPQALAFACGADEIGYGGSAGGGKSDLLLGLAGMQHHRSIIFRRVFPSLHGLIERSREIFNAESRSHLKDSYNESLHRWRLSDGRMIEFGAVQYDQDRKKYQGQPHDFIGIDEATEFPEATVRFLSAWNRTTIPGQRCRLLLTFNPPMDDGGAWVVRYFAPWLDEDNGDPAKDGELRYVVRTDDRDVFYRHVTDVPSGAIYKTRTFFHASLKDNPILDATGYGATIEALPEPLRSFLKGNFNAAKVANPWQVIPAEWVRAAQQRWRECGGPDMSLSAIGADPARGGNDTMVIAKLYGNWCAPFDVYPGAAVPDGPTAAALLMPYAGVSLGIDVIGIGSSVYDSAIANGIRAVAINNSVSVPDARDRSGKFKFRNLRAASYWKLREALDPQHGEDMALPDDAELREELCAPRFSVTTAGIQIESKDDIKARIGRSPDKADALVMARWVVGLGGWSATFI